MSSDREALKRAIQGSSLMSAAMIAASLGHNRATPKTENAASAGDTGAITGGAGASAASAAREIVDPTALPSLPSAIDPPRVGVGHEAINIATLGLEQDFGPAVGVKKLLRTIPRRTPNGQEFIRVHPTYRFSTMVLKLKADGQTYLVDRPLWPSLSSDLAPMSLALATNAQGIVFIWPLRLPRSDGRFDDWGRSAQEGAQQAVRSWVKLVANTHLGAYEIYEAAGAIPEPTWPEEGFDKLINIAYRDHFIRELDHPILRQLRGEAVGSSSGASGSRGPSSSTSSSPHSQATGPRRCAWWCARSRAGRSRGSGRTSSS